MSLLHTHYHLTGQKPETFVTDMFKKDKPTSNDPKPTRPLPRKSVSANSHQLIRNYDHSPLSSPPMSRRNSSSSIKSTNSEPTWGSDYSHDRRSSVASSTKSSASHKSVKSWFKKDKGEKEEKKKKVEHIVLTSRHMAAVKTKMMLDPNYKELRDHHNQNAAKTAGVQGTEHSHHLTAAEQEARHPHSGPPQHSLLSMPALTRIVSADEEDDEVDSYERQRREWNEMKQPDVHDIEENSLSQQNSSNSPPMSGTSSPRRTPVGSRDSSPNRSDGSDVRFGHRTRNTWGAGYRRNDNGVWTKKDVKVLPLHPEHPNILAESIDHKLRVA